MTDKFDGNLQATRVAVNLPAQRSAPGIVSGWPIDGDDCEMSTRGVRSWDPQPRRTIGLNAVETRTDGADIPSGFGFGLLYETDVATATAEIGEAVQDWLSGYEFVLWPVASRSPSLVLKPDVRDGNAL